MQKRFDENLDKKFWLFKPFKYNSRTKETVLICPILQNGLLIKKLLLLLNKLVYANNSVCKKTIKTKS